ncbi:hypothetical protein CASFOL_030245 [Castilleja foliolosa]|uniref:Transcription factor TFIIIC triple barrel domain-containing protein n=1 Tax=Castilleja foliolosa TaxID=1961234 RepID=A0ABD3C7F5_9LAMI
MSESPEKNPNQSSFISPTSSRFVTCCSDDSGSLEENKSSSHEMMESEDNEIMEEEEDYVLLDLDSISNQIHIPPNAPYVLSVSGSATGWCFVLIILAVENPYGLDTLNPILIVDDKIKLIGEYVETIGTCLVFNESDADPIVHKESGPSDANLFSGRCIIDPKQTPAKQVNPIASLHKVLKFRWLLEADDGDKAEKQESKPP